MSLDGVNGFLDVESAALRAPQVGIANTNPQHILSVGSNLYVSGDSSDVLTVDGNVVCEGVKVGLIEITPSYDLEAVANVGNSTSNTILFTNPDTGIVATGNVSVGKTLTVDGIRITAAAEADVNLNAVVATGPSTPLSIQLTGAADSISPYTGTLTIGTNTDNFGGLGVAGNVHVGRGLYVRSNLEVGTANLFVNTVNSRVGIGKTNPDATLDVDGDAIIRGDLSVLGTTTTIDTDNLRVQDPIIELGKDNAGTGDLGLVMTRPSGSSNVAVIFDEDRDTLEIGYTNGGASDTTITMDLAPLSVNVNGNLSVTSNLEVGTANLFVDTTNSRVGVGTSIPTESLDVVGNMNLQQVSNTASIKLNSNVVTEFPRSKKLIKYPRVALTSAALNSAYENGYRVTFSNENTAYRAWEAFDANPGDDVGWHSQGPGASAEYNGTGGLYSGTSRLATETELGEWLGLELPEAIKLIDVNMVSQSYSPTTNTIDNFVVYAKKQSGDTWTSLGVFTGVAAAQNSAAGVTVNVDANDYYKFFAIVATKRDSAGVGTGVSIRDLAFFGVPEYDPEADGVDVVVKSVPNVPNTDWLEVYYDAKDLVDGAVSTVNDLKPSSLGSAINSSSVTDVTVSDEAFVFNGSSSGIDATLSNPQGPWVHSVSVWVKLGKDHSDYNGDNVFSFGNAAVLAQLESLRIHSNDVRFVTFQGGADASYSLPMDRDRWYHFTLTYDGGAIANSFKLFRDGIFYTGTTTAAPVELNIAANSLLSIGYERLRNQSRFTGSIANFRLFNRALTPDEIWQLYAYQKEYFGHGDLGMTLKAGRLGIGTSEPRAALDVRGGFYAPGTIVQVESSTRTNPYTNSGVITPTDVPSLGVTITPKFSTSKVLVSYVVNANSANGHGFLRVKRTQGGSDTFIGLGDAADNRERCTSYMFGNNGNFLESYSFDFLDSADSTTPITYQLQMWVTSSTYTYRINVSASDGNNGYYGRTSSSITVKEVCQ
jgi:hypothetical protein